MKTCTSALFTVSEKFDESDAIGVNIAGKFKKMNSTQYILAESLFQKIIKKCLFSQLTENTDVNEVLHPQSTNNYHYNSNQPDFVHRLISSDSNNSSIFFISQYYEKTGHGLNVL